MDVLSMSIDRVSLSIDEYKGTRNTQKYMMIAGYCAVLHFHQTIPKAINKPLRN